MPKQPISVTLSRENLVWLRGQTRATAGRSVSETLDRLVAEARTGGRLPLCFTDRWSAPSASRHRILRWRARTPRCARSSLADPRYRGPDRPLGRAIGLDRSGG